MARRTRAIICFFACIALNHIFPSLAIDAPDDVTEFLFETTTENIFCGYQGNKFVCDGVIGSFPDIMYCGGYSCDVVCWNCSLTDFDENTFPSTGQRIVSFNASFSEIEVLWPNAFRTLSSTLKKLDLSHNSIYNISEVAFSGLTNLEELYLQYNNITGLPSIFSGLSHLKTLDLSNNHIKGLDPNSFNGLTSCLSLNLSMNEIKYVSSGAFNGLNMLSTLDLGYNSLINIYPLTLTGLSQCLNLYMSNNGIINIELKAFDGLTKLKVLHLQSNSLVLELGIFEGLSVLEELDLSNNSLTNLRTGTFSMLTNLKTLNLSSNSLTKFGGNDVVPLRYLNYIDIANNQLNNVNISNIYYASHFLETVRLEGNIFDCSYLTEVVEFLRGVSVEIDILNKQYFIANIIGIPCIE